MTPPPLPTTGRPAKPLPDGAWDCHAHVFGPFDRFPLDPACRYTPPLATADDHRAMLDAAGFANGMLVHASACGYDNRATLDAVARSNGRIGAIGVVSPEIDDDTLAAMKRGGMRGLRFTKAGPRTSDDPWPGVLDLPDFAVLAPRLREHGLTAHVFAPCAALVGMADQFRSTAIPIVFDHMGQPDVAAGTEDPTFRSFVAMVGDGPFAVKLTPGRLSTAFPDYDDVRPFHDALIEAVADRLIFGSDWPFLGQMARAPDVAAMVDLFDRWTPDESIRRAVFVDTPTAFFA
ncbi:amidohydrolase [Sphingomonas sp.]|uniref:amidohydrolase family protein n=1 Tax=Sphingomonas sp. TaxID=28214 RepID=UPI000DB6D56A|nr:amidohydrolase family protein [Sphingomonas sp.]PZU06477.1 MAG: metal-dependent hydrolase [Sphingomonas sp.]